jgi:hypothetical protein
MSYENLSLISKDKFIQKFVHAIILNIRAKNFAYGERHVIHADLVPRMSERTMQASLGERTTRKVPVMSVVAPPVVRKKREIHPLLVPIVMPKRPARPMAPRQMPPVQAPAPVQTQPTAQAPAAPQGATLSQDYGKITPLLNDPSVSTIECSGAGKPLMIIRAGQKQGTRIVLTAEEIKEILHKVSDAVHIPLLEGVFRAAVDNFNINAVISEMIGSRFVIKKQTAYAMLE